MSDRTIRWRAWKAYFGSMERSLVSVLYPCVKMDRSNEMTIILVLGIATMFASSCSNEMTISLMFSIATTCTSRNAVIGS
jgi:hypothetical protein